MKKKITENKKFLIYWIMQYISSLANALHVLVLPLWIYSFSQSKFSAGLTLSIETITILLFSPFAGNIVDRYNRKFIILSCDFTRALTMLLLFFVTSSKYLWLLYFTAFINSFVYTLFLPVSNAAVQSLVKKENILKANSLMSLTFGTTLILGPTIGMSLVNIFGYNKTFLINGFTFILAAFGSSFITFKKIEDNKKGNFLLELKKGFIKVKENRQINFLILLQFITYLGIGANSFLFVIFLKDSGVLEQNIAKYMMCQGIGILIGSTLISKYVKKIQNLYLIVSIFLMGITLYTFTKTVSSFQLISYSALIFFGIFFVFFGISIRSTIQKKVEVEYIGRVTGFSKMIVQFSNSMSLLIATFLIDKIEAEFIINLGAYTLIIVSFIIFMKGVKNEKSISDFN